MNQPLQPIERDAFLALLRDRTANGVYMITLDGGELPVSVRLRESSSLVFSFTGAAANRANFSLPHFAVQNLSNHLPVSIIGFSDPSLERNDDLKTAWFAGHEGFELQKLLPPLIQQMVDNLGVTRVGFVGGSSGGFAALYYSWHVPDSVAIVTNPQTNLQRYLPTPIANYRSVCWPSLDPQSSLDTVIDTDLCVLYGRRFENTVIYLQVSSDYSHLRRQFAPFIAALPRGYANRLIVRMANWGRWGHKPAPATIWIPWMRAALSAPKTTTESIEQTWTEQNPYQLPSLEPLTRPYSRDEQIAAELALFASKTLLSAHNSNQNLA